MLAANSAVELRARRLAIRNRHFHKTSDARLIKLGERIVFINLIVVIRAEELARIVAREAKGHLRQVVRAKAEELRLFRNLSSDKRRARNFDHRADFIVELNFGSLNFFVRDMDDNILNELELLRVSCERNHDFRTDIPTLVATLNGNRRADDGLGLHNRNFRIRNAEATAAVTHHRIEFMQRIDDILNAARRLVHGLCEQRNFIFRMRHEFVQRRIEEANGDGLTVERFEKLFKVILLIRKNLRKRKATLFDRVGANHLAKRRNTALREEHVFRAAKANAFRAKFAPSSRRAEYQR